MSKSNEVPFSALLRSFRAQAGLSQEALAGLADVGKDTISGLERGSRRYPYVETVTRLARALALESADRERFERAAKRPSAARPRRNEAPHAPPAAGVAGRATLEPIPLVGRDAGLSHVRRMLASHRLVTLVGTGGVGKTRIAREIGAALRDEFEHGVAFLELAPLRDATLLEERLAKAVGMHADQTGAPEIAAFLQTRRALIILDNCEHVIDAAARVVDAILRSCPDVTILATSRERLQLAHEHAYRVPSLTIPPARATPEEILASEAGRFFCERARATRHSFAVTNENAPLIADICHRLDGIPLALELAAALVESFGIADIATMLDRRFRLLTSGHRMSLSRHQTMRALIDWSFDLLSEGERTFFIRLAAFAAGWSSDAAEYVCRFGALEGADVVELLSSLVNKSMIAMEVVSERARYRLLESTRAYAYEKLAESEDAAEVERRLAYWIAEFAERSRREIHTLPRALWLRPLVDELENARAALAWADDTRDAGIAARIVSGYRLFWLDGGHFAEGLRWIARFADLPATVENFALQAAFWHARATLTSGQHRIDAAVRAMTRFEHLDDREGLASALLTLGVGYRQTARFEHAELTLRRALELYRDSGLSHSILYGIGTGYHASVLAILGRRDEARAAFSSAIALEEAAGDRERAAAERLNLAEMEFVDGNIVEALAQTETSLAALDGRHEAALVTASLNAAAYLIVLGDYDRAEHAARAALAHARRASFRMWTIIAVAHLATLRALAGDVRRAALLLGYVEAAYTAEGSAREPTERATFDILTRALAGRLTPADKSRIEACGAALADEDAAAIALGEDVPAALAAKMRG
jgi:predicted ATPase